MVESKLHEIQGDLAFTLGTARSYWEIWWAGTRRDAVNRSHTEQCLDMHNDVLSSMLNACQTACIVRLGSAFDTRGDSISLKTLLNEIEKHPLDKGVPIPKLKQDFDALRKDGRAFYSDVRCKVAAHRDQDLELHHLPSSYGKKNDEVAELLTRSIDLFQEMSTHVQNARPVHAIQTDWPRLFNSLMSAISGSPP